MKKNKSFTVVFCLALLLVLAIPNTLKADEWDKATKITFNEAVEVPGRVLEAGSYWFTLADSQSDRNIVQIWNADRTQLITTLLAIPNYRLRPSGTTVVNFEERPSNSPEAIHAWFYPGDNYGQEFVYPRTRATQLAKQASRPVLSMPDQQASEEMKQTPVKAITPSGEETEIAEVIAVQPVIPQEAQQNSLPQTGSSVPVVFLVGVLALVLAGAVRLTLRLKA